MDTSNFTRLYARLTSIQFNRDNWNTLSFRSPGRGTNSRKLHFSALPFRGKNFDLYYIIILLFFGTSEEGYTALRLYCKELGTIIYFVMCLMGFGRMDRSRDRVHIE